MLSKRFVVAFVACLAVTAALVGCGHPAIGDKVVGWWQEVGTTPAYKMHITRLSDGEYQVTYPRSFRVPFRAQLKGDHLDIWGENASDVIYRITYDAQTGQLKAVHSTDGTAYTLKRITS
jgi:hypothetical protein